jgi:sec-independent protein translocase protein TatA
MGLSPIHIILLALVAVLVLGGGRFSALMGDVAKGVKQFKKGMAEDDSDDRPAPPRPSPRLQAQQPVDPVVEAEPQPIREDRPRI